MGYSDQARRWRLEALAEAQRTTHHFSRAYAKSLPLVALHYLRDVEGARVALEDAVASATEQSIVFWLLFARLFRGWILLEDGRPDEAILAMRETIAAYRATGSDIVLPQYMTVLAQALVRTGAIDQAFEVLGQALEQIEREGERHYEAETYRLKGDFLIAQKNDPDGAERNYLRAVAVARDQQAKLFELRASTSLARFWHCNDKTEEACNLLNPVY